MQSAAVPEQDEEGRGNVWYVHVCTSDAAPGSVCSTDVTRSVRSRCVACWYRTDKSRFLNAVAAQLRLHFSDVTLD